MGAPDLQIVPMNVVTRNYQLPFPLYEFQADAVNDLAPLERAGYYLDVGTGKTITSIAACLYKMHLGMVKHVICLMPPVLITNWARTLSKIPGVTHTEYRGTPTVRAKLNLGTQFILMSYQIFKKDWAYLAEQFNLGEIALVCDEAKAIKNVGSDTYKKVRDFATGNHILLLEGTPLNSPVDGYAYVRTTSPGVYRNLAQFERIHVEERDFFNKPTKWQNLELLRENLKLNSVRILKRDVLKDLPPITYTPIYYDLAPKHLKLYNELADQQFKLLSNGDKIDLTNASALYNALQQIPCNAEHFSGGELDSTIWDLIDETMDELDGGKLVVYTRYVMTNRRIIGTCQKHNVVSVYGEISPKQKQLAIDRFVQDPDCRMIVLQTEAGGAGIDGLQDVCCDGLFIEQPLIPTTFHQACGRIDRSGQKLPVNIRVAIANKTIQHRIFEMVMEKDTLVNSVVRGPKDIRDAIHGL